MKEGPLNAAASKSPSVQFLSSIASGRSVLPDIKLCHHPSAFWGCVIFTIPPYTKGAGKFYLEKAFLYSSFGLYTARGSSPFSARYAPAAIASFSRSPG